MLCDCGEGGSRGGGGAQIGEDEGGRGRGGCIFIRQGAFLIVEHLLATMLSVTPSPGRMPARGIMEHLLAMMVSLPASPLLVGQATVIFYYIVF
jgi:hypothetical protein